MASGQLCLFPGYSVCVGSHRTTRWTAGRDTTAQPTQDRGDPDRPSKLEGGLGAVADKRQRGTPKSGGGATLAAIASFARIGISIHNRQRRREQGGRAGRVSRSTEIPIFRFQDY